MYIRVAANVLGMVLVQFFDLRPSRLHGLIPVAAAGERLENVHRGSPRYEEADVPEKAAQGPAGVDQVVVL